MHQGLMNKKLRGGAAERKITESSMMRLMLLTLLMMMMTIMKEKNWDLFSCRLGLGLSKKSDSSQQQPRMEGHQFSADFWWQLRLKLSLIDASAEGKLNEKPKADFCGIQAGLLLLLLRGDIGRMRTEDRSRHNVGWSQSGCLSHC